jgi:hypothetical protein
MAGRGTLLLPEFPLRLIGSFADYETCRRKFKIKKPNDIFRIKRIFQSPRQKKHQVHHQPNREEL